MATTKNITMKQFNGTDYDTLYPKTVYNQVSGVAPDGYGLGANTARLITDGNDALVGGWFYWENIDTNLPFTYGHLRVDPRLSSSNGQILMQTAYSNSYPGCVAQRKMINGAFKPWEWVNPPMTLGVEYRTTERYLEKPVYARLVNCGNMPSAGGVKTVQAPYEGTTNPIRYAWIYNAELTYHGQSLPSFTYGAPPTIRAAVSTNGNGSIQIVVDGKTDWSNENANLYVFLKYTKNTD